MWRTFVEGCRPYRGPSLPRLVTRAPRDGSHWAIQSWQRVLPEPRRFVGWQTFFDFGDGEVKPNKLIDTKLSTPLFDFPLGAIASHDAPTSLPQRTLLRHLTWSLPSGQKIARELARNRAGRDRPDRPHIRDPLIDVLTLTDDRISAVHVVPNNLGLMMQLGSAKLVQSGTP